MPPKTGSKQTFKVEDLSFLLNLSGQTSTGLTKEKIVEKLGIVSSDRVVLLNKFKSVMENAEFIDEIEQMGWFHKNYETVRKHVEVFYERAGLPFVYNKPKKVSDKEDIAKLLFFCHLRGHQITCKIYDLVPEQQEVVDVAEGISVVNSSAGPEKTQTEVAKAARFINEGVLVVAYTNAAVKNFIQRLYEVVDDARQVSKEADKKIWVTTIDTICRSNSRGVYKGVDFSKRIRAANRDLEQKTDIFLDHENKPKYLHLIIDEAQDIDDDRFRYLFNIFRTWNFKSMTFLGDPKQRMNINAGGIFQDLFNKGIPADRRSTVQWDTEQMSWIAKDTAPMPEQKLLESEDWFMNCCPLIFEYHTTFRFRNPVLLKIANHLSAIRPKIHSEIHLHESIEKLEEKKLVKMTTIQEVAAEIDALITGGVRPNQICLMSPVTEKQSKIRQNYRDIQQLLSTRQIICDDQLHESTVYSTSIVSAKGLEFDYVFFVGASRFPSFLQGSLSDANDGVSMNYVANTRARVQMYYMTDASNLPPDNIPQELVTSEVVKRTNYTKFETYRFSIKSSEIAHGDHKDYEDRNRLFLKIVERAMTSNHLEPKRYQHFIYEIISYILTSVGGYNKFQANGEYAIIEDKDFRNYVKNGKCVECSMRVKDKPVIVIPRGTEEIVNHLAEDTEEEDIEYHKNYARMMNNRGSMLEDLDQIAEPCTQLTKLVHDLAERGKQSRGCGDGKAGESGFAETAEHVTAGTFMKAPMIQGHTYAIVFTESVFLAASIKASNSQKTVIMVGLETGRFIEIVRTPSSVRRYNKVCQDLYTLTASIRLMQERGKFSLAEISRDKEIYFVDTEFTPTAWNKSGSIYEIAVINAFHPYRSFATYLRPDINRFRIFVGDDTLQYNHIKDAPSAFEFIAAFRNFVTPSKTIIYYFSTMHDIAPFYETHESFHKAWGISEDSDDDAPEVISDKPEDWKYNLSVDYGYEFVNGRIGGGAGKLNEVYNYTTGSSLSTMPHLVHHVAISDAMMLMEYVFTRDHPAA